MLLRRRIHGDSLSPLQPDGTPPHLNTYFHTLNDYKPNPDLIMAHKATKMVENEEKMQFYLLL
jgi:hypothetical protein